jgi:hypothetical protein
MMSDPDKFSRFVLVVMCAALTAALVVKWKRMPERCASLTPSHNSRGCALGAVSDGPHGPETFSGVRWPPL